MAAKRIFKFILKMIVAAAIVVGAYFGISAIANRGGNPNNIIDVSNSENISVKLVSSHDGLQSEDANLQTKINVLDNINIVLLDYYNYYMMLTPYKNYPSTVGDDVLINKIKELSNQINSTSRFNLMTKVSVTNNATLKEQRILLTAKEYAKQTKLLFEVNELLRQYVYESNYNLSSTGVVYEAQLEMIKDFAKAIFNYGLDEKIDITVPENVLQSGENTSFLSTFNKFRNRQSLAVNGNLEVSFVKFYNEMSKEDLSSFYILSLSEKQIVVNNKSERQKMYFNSLLEYIKQDNI